MDTLLVIAAPGAEREVWRDFGLEVAARSGLANLHVIEPKPHRSPGRSRLERARDLAALIELEWNIAGGYEDVLLLGVDLEGLLLGRSFVDANEARRPWARRVSRVVVCRSRRAAHGPTILASCEDRFRAALELDLEGLARSNQESGPAVFSERATLEPNEWRRVLHALAPGGPRPRRVVWILGRSTAFASAARTLRDLLVADGGATLVEPVEVPGPLGIAIRGRAHRSLDVLATRYAELELRWPGIEHVAWAHAEGAWMFSQWLTVLPAVRIERVFITCAWLSPAIDWSRMLDNGSLREACALGAEADLRNALLARALGSLRPKSYVGDAGRSGFDTTHPRFDARAPSPLDEASLLHPETVRGALEYLLTGSAPAQVRVDLEKRRRLGPLARAGAALAGLAAPLLVALAAGIALVLIVKGSALFSGN